MYDYEHHIQHIIPAIPAIPAMGNSYTIMFDQGEMVPPLPAEVWALIAEYCSPKTLKTLSLVSRNISKEALRLLYRSIEIHDMPSARDSINHLRLLNKSLHSWSGWQDAVREISLTWRETDLLAYEDRYRTARTLEARRQKDDLVLDTLHLLSQAPNLRSFHISPPRLDSTIPFRVDNLTSLRIPMTGSMLYGTRGSGFATLLKLFQIPSLHRIEIEAMAILCHLIPPSCHQRGTSNVKEISFINCGPLSEELTELLLWPKDLQTLDFDVRHDDLIETNKIIQTLTPLRHSLQDLTITYEEGEGDGLPYPQPAFRGFSKLRKLEIPFLLLMQYSNSSHNHNTAVTLPLHGHLPSTLEDLRILLPPSFKWRLHGSSSIKPESEVLAQIHETFTFFSDLAPAKREFFPGLHRLDLVHHDFNYGAPSSRQNRDFPAINCERLNRFLGVMGGSGVEVLFNSVEGTVLVDPVLWRRYLFGSDMEKRVFLVGRDAGWLESQSWVMTRRPMRVARWFAR